MNQPILILVILVLIVALGTTILSSQRRARARARLWDEAAPAFEHRPELGRIARWLMLAGIRGPTASLRFGLACLLCASIAAVGAPFMAASPQLTATAYDLSSLPVMGAPLAQLVLMLPWFAALLLGGMPALLVRARRDRRIVAVEEDLPLVLELLATLAEGGLGFDASLDRVIESQPSGRPLVDELQIYRLEVRGGGSRVECLQRLASRLEVTPVNNTVAALIQAEEMGSGLADILRPLAEDLRQRRRERALAKAEALPEKLVFPLVIGFLPALLVWTLGPSFFQLVNTIDTITRGTGQ
ncbi:MAG: type II secretion system F family protein [Myxococcota bacterium]|nr:type II secretion system F family protein [Myxococcota bacterium]